MKITFLGDIMCEKGQIKSHTLADGSFDFSNMFCNISGLKDTDWVVANLETPIAPQQLFVSELYSFNAPEEFAQEVKECGVDMVIGANNHCLDRGKEGLLETIDTLHEVGFDVLGIHNKKEESYIIKNICGIKVGFMAFTYGTNAFVNNCYLDDTEDYMVDLLQAQELACKWEKQLVSSNALVVRYVRKIGRTLGAFQLNKPVHERRGKHGKQERKLKSTIKECKKAGAEAIFVCIHIGGQYNDKPNNYTRKMCKKILRWGRNCVKAVIANHEHVIHPMDISQINSEKIAVYSLGNFISEAGNIVAPYDKSAEYSMAFHVYIERIKGKLELRYAFSLYKSSALNGKIYTKALIDCINEEQDKEEKRVLLEKNNLFVNKILGTQDRKYKLQREYEIGMED